MNPERLDDLMDRTLDSGDVPGDATAEERAELEPLLAAANLLKAERVAAGAEARAARPTARARFERHLAEQTAGSSPAPAPPPPRPKRRAFRYGALAAALGIIVLTAILVLRPFSSTETALALSVDDYVQVPGVVSATGDGAITVSSSEFGEMDILVSELTSVVDESGALPPAELRPGDSVLIGGIVRHSTRALVRIDANTVAVARRGAERPVRQRLEELRDLRVGVEGRLAAISITPGGETARVVIQTEADRHVLVTVGKRTIEGLLASGTAVGRTVRVVEGARKGAFELVALDEPQPPPVAEGTLTPNQRPDEAEPGGEPSFVTIEGVIEARRSVVLQVRTARGLVPVQIRPSTRIFLGESELTLESVRDGERAIGHTVTVTGGLDPATGRVVADVIVLGPRAER